MATVESRIFFFCKVSMNKISLSRPPESLQASNTGQKNTLEAMPSTKLDAKILEFFLANLRPNHCKYAVMRNKQNKILGDIFSQVDLSAISLFSSFCWY